MSTIDTIQRFLIESANIRGEIVQLSSSLTRVFALHDYSTVSRHLLAETIAASVLLSATIKFKGQLSIQLQGDKKAPLQLMVVQCSNDFFLRAILHMRESSAANDLSTLLGKGQLAITVQSTQYVQPYQSFVALQHGNLSKCLEAYFQQSEQLPTRLYLAASNTNVVGLLLQILPEKNRHEDDWRRITLLADTLTPAELLQLDADKIIKRLYHEETVRLFTPQAIHFRCTCSLAKMEDSLRVIGKAEAYAILTEEGKLDIICDFCQCHYEFMQDDIISIFNKDNSARA